MHARTEGRYPHRLCRLRAGDVEFEIRIFLPVTKEQRELEKESVVGITEGGKRLGAGVAVEAPFLSFAGTDELFPGLKTIGVRFLYAESEQVQPNMSLDTGV